MDTMDVDMDIDLGNFDDGELNQLQPDQVSLSATQTQSNGVDRLQISNELETVTPTPHKIYIRGLDDLTTGDINQFSSEHFPDHAPTRVEWIDDFSANIVFENPATAMRALQRFTLPAQDGVSIPDLQLRPAKSLSTHQASSLQLRMAVFTDQKRPKAYEASRFYMMHPEHDPRERRRRNTSKNNSDYRSRRYSDEEHRRRRHKDQEEGFDASMYDDNGPSSKRHSAASSPDSRSDERSSHHRRRGDSYRPARRDKHRLSRDRSASPGRRQYTPPPAYRSRDPHPFPDENKGKELFPLKSAKSNERNGVGKDLFSNKIVAASMKKELFPHKTNTVNHRRSDAFDAADETADLFANGLSVPFAEGTKSGKSLADRISSRTNVSHGRLNPEVSGSSTTVRGVSDEGLNIRGASSQRDQGFSIRGGAAAAGTIKELFPGKKIGNAGKELFAEKLEGRGGRRNKAEDMFY
ncbi:hypothetical protein P7C71_g2510, partial [Lecanoromycetidae sp. Uapishka_2]